MIEPPLDIKTGKPLFSDEVWQKMSEAERTLAYYKNSPHKQRVGELYRRSQS